MPTSEPTATPDPTIRTCPLCEATCGLQLDVVDGEVRRIRGDRDDVFSHGFVCPKGTTLGHLHTDPDRLRRPLVRREAEDGTVTHEEVGWDEAFAEVARVLAPVLESGDRQCLGIYLGNPNVHNHANTIYSRALILALGTRNVYSASTVDQMPKHVSSGLLYGNALAIPVPDLDATDHLVLLGANPWESNGSVCTAPDFPGRIEAIRERGGKVVVIDPKRTKTADHSDEHVPIRPGTDAFLLLAVAQVLADEDRIDLGTAGEHVSGLDEVLALVAPFTPEAVAETTSVPADTIRRLAREIAEAPTAAVYGRIGTHTVPFGTLAAWAVDLVNLLTGNLDRPGGILWPAAAHTGPNSGPGGGRGFALGRWTSRVRGLPEAKSELPVATLADEILEPGEGRIRALITVAGNPALSCPNSARMTEALESLEALVCVDPFLNETSRHAHVVLPPPSQLERSHYDLAFYGLAVRNVANYTPPLFPPVGPREEDILARLSLIAQGQPADADPAFVHDLTLSAVLAGAVGRPGPVEGRDLEELKAQLGDRSPADRVLEAMLRTGQYGDQFGAVPDGLTLDLLEANPHGIDFGPLTPQLPGILKTASATVELATEPIVAEIERLRSELDAPAPDLLLVGRRHLRSNNSWMHNVRVLVKGKDRCTLEAHPDDLDRLGLTEGGRAVVTSRVGSVEVPVEASDRLLPGVVSLPHGWGHDQEGTRMDVARDHAGVNSNVLTDELVLDPLSGNATLNAIPVEVVPAPG